QPRFPGSAGLWKDSPVGPSPSRLLQRQTEELGAFFLGKKGAGDACLVLRAPDAVRAIRFRIDGRVGALAERMAAQGRDGARAGDPGGEMDASAGFAADGLELDLVHP